MNGSGLVFAVVALVLGAVIGALAMRTRSATTVARLDTQLTHARVDADEKLALLRAEQDRFADEFERMTSVALRQNRDEFLHLAGERLEPLSQHLGKVEAQATALERTRTEAFAELRTQLAHMGKSSEQLRLETQQLVTALRAPQVRGRWGELQLRRVVETAGMLEHVDFTEQASVDTVDGKLRPDLVVSLSGGKRIVVDAKVAFNGFLEAQEARDEVTRTARLAAHARHLKAHIDSLAGKQYWEQFAPTPEFVVMFVPSEVFLSAALEQDPTLYEHAFERNVVIATPSTLVALL
ncbi:MAG: DNA recombination protein RmuC, partial [Jiangellaceae bacterium]